jgi:hypothetical protein
MDTGASPEETPASAVRIVTGHPAGAPPFLAAPLSNKRSPFKGSCFVL